MPPNSVPLFSRLIRADKYAVSSVTLPNIARITSNRVFNIASKSVGDDNPGRQKFESEREISVG